MSTLVGKWGYSNDEEHYQCSFDTAEEAMDEARELSYRVIGQFREVPQPETYFDASDLLDNVHCQDEYGNDWGDDWPDATAEQVSELTASIRKAFAEWLDKHDLRPGWAMVDEKTIQQVR